MVWLISSCTLFTNLSWNVNNRTIFLPSIFLSVQKRQTSKTGLTKCGWSDNILTKSGPKALIGRTADTCKRSNASSTRSTKSIGLNSSTISIFNDAISSFIHVVIMGTGHARVKRVRSSTPNTSTSNGSISKTTFITLSILVDFNAIRNHIKASSLHESLSWLTLRRKPSGIDNNTMEQ